MFSWESLGCKRFFPPAIFSVLIWFLRIKGGPFMDRFNTIFDGLSAGRHLLRSAMVEIPSMLRKVGFHDLLELQQFFPLGGWAGPLGKRDLELWYVYLAAITVWIYLSVYIAFF